VALAWYVIAYDVGRFLMEFARGDIGRPYRLGFSEAQWISLILTWVIVGAELLGAVEAQPWRLGAAVGLTLIMLLVALRRSGQDPIERQVLYPTHVQEVARALAQTTPPDPLAAPVRVVPTSLGIQISGTVTEDLAVYTLSARQGTLTDRAAHRLADLIALLSHTPHISEVQRGRHGVVHVLIQNEGVQHTTPVMSAR
jgi:hypothetical protein